MTTRRDFLRTTAGAGAGAAFGIVPTVEVKGAPAVLVRRVTPVSVDGDTRLEDSAYLFERN